MTDWQPDDLAAIASTDDFHVTPFRDDGVTPGTPTWIWSVVVDGNVYVRAYDGQRSRWCQAAVAQRAGRISAADEDRDVTFEAVDRPVNADVDAAYRDKYADSPYLDPMISDRARSATVMVTPRHATA